MIETVYVDPHPEGGWVVSCSDGRDSWDVRLKKDAVRQAKDYAQDWADEGVDVGVEVDGDEVAYYEGASRR